MEESARKNKYQNTHLKEEGSSSQEGQTVKVTKKKGTGGIYK